jgi:hypothetical protein
MSAHNLSCADWDRIQYSTAPEGKLQAFQSYVTLFKTNTEAFGKPFFQLTCRFRDDLQGQSMKEGVDGSGSKIAAFE